jgi:hypothetical protein
MPAHRIKSRILLGMKYLGAQPMNFRGAYAIAAVTFSILSIPASSEAAGPQIRGRFSFDGLANCDNPPIRNFPIHGEGTGVLSVDRSATLDMNSTVEGRVRYNATLGGKPTEAPAGSASLHVVGRHTLRAIRDYPNNVIIINMTIRGTACTMTIENRLKPGKRQYTFFNGSGISYCAKPQITRSECVGY